LLDSLGGADGQGILSYIVLFLFYVVTYSVTIFANSALIGAALIRLNGGDPTLQDGFRIASERLGKILGYAVISATVGMVLRAISERSGIIGQIVIGIIGFVWSVATFLTVPVLVTEDVGPIDAVKRSAELLKKDLGRTNYGQFWHRRGFWPADLWHHHCGGYSPLRLGRIGGFPSFLSPGRRDYRAAADRPGIDRLDSQRHLPGGTLPLRREWRGRRIFRR
jgi:hypothetical protein